MKLALAAALVAVAAQAAEPKQLLLAVLEFRTKLDAKDKADADPTYFSDVVRSRALDELPGARVMTRENMTVLIQATGKDLASCEGECEVDTGRNLGADAVINGELLKVGSSFKLDLKLHSTADGALLAGVQASAKNVDELDAAVPAAVARLLAPLRVRAAPAVSSLPRQVASAPAAKQAYRYIRVVDGRIVHIEPFFDTGRREVKPAAQPMLREIAVALRGPPKSAAMVICRGDDDSSAARRSALQRSWALRHALVELGIAPHALEFRGGNAADQAQLVTQVAHPYPCEIVLRPFQPQRR